MAENSNTPAIRFKGFTDPWEQRKLGELIQLGGSGGTPSATNPAYYGGDIPFLSIADIDGRDIANTAKTLTDEGLQNSAAWIVPAGAVSLAMYASVGKVGIIRQNTATSQAFYNMTFEDEALRDFVFTRLEKAEADSEWEPYISMGTQRNLNADKVRSFSLEVPSTEEASEVSAYFANLDHLITLHQCKSIDEPLFIVFAWEQRKLGELASEFQSGEFIAASNIYDAGPYPVYGGNGLRGYTDTFNHEGFYALIGRQGALCGNVNSADGKSYFTEHAVAVQANQANDTGFLVHLLGTMNLGQYSGQSAQPGLAVGVLKEVETLTPTKEEQRLIGSYFAQLDSLITLHQCVFSSAKTD